ncbi:hypothetical protein AKJ47_00975 [candidate division MSBL1 archaeon SCGC-AAA261G05]|uniref:(2Fe-2S)-binding protein n=2 Tax=candidate division MSBL1 TaxID=215777 RepID=A0A133VC75_9EURY|nr:hypothetical protein AKJ47_00975 [candidate division MSBL1 archaeon SCGC-AAA261G05]KXB04963.1 hypothetical protein AKJ48_00785 [candidate division MSBL1 archaeon SCGC-AAA261O19]
MGEITLKIDEREIKAEEEKTVLEVAKENGIEIPTHCHREPYEPVGACRLCLVEVQVPGAKPELKPACTYPIREGLKVKTSTAKVQEVRKLTAELLLARCPNSEEVRRIAEKLGVKKSRFSPKDLDCTLCGLCVRACKAATGDNVIVFAGKGLNVEILTPSELSSEECQSCGVCAEVCPTNAIKMLEIEEEKH